MQTYDEIYIPWENTIIVETKKKFVIQSLENPLPASSKSLISFTVLLSYTAHIYFFSTKIPTKYQPASKAILLFFSQFSCAYGEFNSTFGLNAETHSPYVRQNQ